MAATTVIRNAGIVMAWDAAAGRHVYLRDADLAFAGTAITHAGRGYAGPADAEIDGRGLMVMPGLIDLHSHPTSEPLNKGLIDEVGSAGLYNSSLYEYMPIFRSDPEAVPDCVRVAYAELLLSGVTTLVDLSMPHPAWLDLIATSGLRGVVAPMYRSARWFTRNGHLVEYEWDEAAGRKAMDEALALIDAAIAHPCGRLSGMVAPAQIDTCSEGLLRDSAAAAAERGLPLQLHAAQSVVEFHEITRRHGHTPIAWLDRLGVLGPRSIVGHGIFLDDHPATRWSTDADLRRLAETGTTVAHCPTVFARRGIALRDLGRYLRAGVRVAVGTDTYPHNMLDELRLASYLARVVAGSPRTASSTDLLGAVTTAAAAALGREDIGRLAPGCKADLVLVDLDHPLMQPGRDPFRALIYCASDRAVRDVFVDGRQVVRAGRVLTIDYPASARALTAHQQRVLGRATAQDYAGRPVDEIAPPTCPTA